SVTGVQTCALPIYGKKDADDAGDARQQPEEDVARSVGVGAFRANVLACLRVITAVQTDDVLFLHEVGAIGTAAALIQVGYAVRIAAFFLLIHDRQDAERRL